MLLRIPPTGPPPLRVDLINEDVVALLKKFQNHKQPGAEIYREYGRHRAQVNLPSNFDDPSPSGRPHAIALAMAEGAGCRTFLKAAEMMHTLRSAQGSLQSVASGVRSYFRYCAVMNWTPSRRRKRQFLPGALFSNQIGHSRTMWHALKRLATCWALIQNGTHHPSRPSRPD